MAAGNLNETSLSIGKLTAQYEALKEQFTALDTKVDTHFEHLRESLHALNSSLSEISVRLHNGSKRMDAIDAHVQENNVLAQQVSNRLDRHMDEEEEAIRALVAKQTEHSKRLDALDHPEQGRVPKVEQVADTVRTVERGLRGLKWLLAFIASGAAFLATVKGWFTT